MSRSISGLALDKLHTDANDAIAENSEPVDAREHPHFGWAEAAKLMHERGEDQLLDPFFPAKFDEEQEWE